MFSSSNQPLKLLQHTPMYIVGGWPPLEFLYGIDGLERQLVCRSQGNG